MLLAPGPIPTLSATVQNAPSSDPGFAALVSSELAPLSLIEAAMDALLPAGALIDILPPDDGLGPILDATDAGLATFSAFDGSGDAAALDVSQATAGEAIGAAFQSTPAEAWQPVPLPIDYSGGTAAPVGVVAISVNVVNLTRPGWNNFYPGDTYRIDVKVSAAALGAGNEGNVEVYLFLIQNGTIVPLHDLGATDAFGNLSCQGVIQDNDVGNWSIQPFLYKTGAYDVQGQFYTFTVFALPPPYTSNIPPGQVITAPGLYPTCTVGGLPQGTPITVQLTNTSGGSNTAFRQGDTWHLEITGPVRDEILIWATLNGVALPKLVLGMTDFNGNFTRDGVFDLPDYIGQWSEFYQVGTEVWTGQLQFTVAAQTAALTPAQPIFSAPVITQGAALPPAFQPGGIFGGGSAPPAQTAPGLQPGGILGGGTGPPASSSPGLVPGGVLG